MERTKKTHMTEEPMHHQPVQVEVTMPAASIAQYVTMGLLIIAAFFLGSLSSKVQLLEKGVTKTNPTQPQGVANQPQPTKPVGDIPKITDKDYIRGNKNAQIALIEYSDMECPFCKRYHPTMLQVMKEYGNKVQWVYRHYPLSFHANAQKEAEAAECAGSLGGQDAFWKYLDAVYDRTTSNGTGFALDALVPLAKELGLSETTFKQCLDSGQFAQKVKNDMTGGTQAGVSGTPGTLVYDTKSGKSELIPGALPYEQVKPIIDKFVK